MIFWAANDLENVSSSVLLSSGLALGDGVAGDEVVGGTKFRQGPNIDFSLVLLYKCKYHDSFLSLTLTGSESRLVQY